MSADTIWSMVEEVVDVGAMEPLRCWGCEKDTERGHTHVCTRTATRASVGVATLCFGFLFFRYI